MEKRNEGLFGALYLRISRDKGENEDTLQNHREIMAKFCESHGFIYESYEEIVSGGKQDIESRPQLQRLIDNIEKYEAIYCISLDRLSRNGLVSQQIKQLCIDYEILIITPSQTFDLANSQEDRVLYDVSSMFASMEYEMIAKRMRLNKMQRAARGEWISSKPAYGFRRNQETKKLEIYEPEAKVVRYIFELHGQGLGAFRIVDILNAEGYKPQLSNAFNLPTVKRIIQNPVYKGTVVYHNRKRVKEGGKYVYKVVDTITTENAHPPIIPPDEWERANLENRARSERSRITREKPSKVSGVTMLKDLVYCGVCGRKMTIRIDRNDYTLKRCEYLLKGSSERCPNCGIRVDYLEGAVLSKLKDYRKELKKELRKLEKLDLTKLKKDYNDRLTHIKAEIRECNRRQNNLIDAVAEGLFTLDELKAKKQELTNRLQSLEEKRKRITREAAEIDVSSHIDRIEHIIGLLDNIEKLPPEGQNRALKQFVKAIYFTRLIPDDIRKLSTRNPERRGYPFEYTIEYY